MGDYRCNGMIGPVPTTPTIDNSHNITAMTITTMMIVRNGSTTCGRMYVLNNHHISANISR